MSSACCHKHTCKPSLRCFDSVPHLHVCNQPGGDTDRPKTHTVLPDTVRVHLREIMKLIKSKVLKQKDFTQMKFK